MSGGVFVIVDNLIDANGNQLFIGQPGQPEGTVVTNNNNVATEDGGERFFLEQLNITVNSELATLHGGQDTDPNDVSANHWANLDIPVSYARNLFQYQVDAIDVNDQNIDDIKFRMFHVTDSSGGISDASNNLKYYNTKNIIPAISTLYFGAVPFYGNASVSNISSNETIKQLSVNADYIRHVAQEMFGVAATDLFNNELYVRNELIKSSANAFFSKINTLVNETTDGSYVLMNDISGNTLRNKFPTKLIFKQMMDNVRSRFNNINQSSDADSSNNLIHLFDASNQPITILNEDDGARIFDANGVRIDPSNSQILWRKLPLMPNDKLFFRLTITPAVGQNDFNGNSVSTKNYRIRLNIVNDNNPSVTGSLPARAWDNIGYNSNTDFYQQSQDVAVI